MTRYDGTGRSTGLLVCSTYIYHFKHVFFFFFVVIFSQGKVYVAGFPKEYATRVQGFIIKLCLCSLQHSEEKMSSRSQHYGFQSATMVQPANGGHAYLFGNNGSENDLSEEDGDVYELRPRGRERLRRSTSRERMEDIIYLTRDIQEGDTLNSISLQYHCSVRPCVLSSINSPFISMLK